MASGSSSNSLRGFKSKTLFPPPQFLSLHHCGIDISQGAARFIRFDDSYKGVRIKSFGETPIPRIETASPEKVATEADKAALASLVRKAGTRFVRVVVPEDEVYLFRMRAPRVHDAELRNVIDFKLEENVPIARGDALFEYDIMETLENEYSLSVSVLSSEFIRKATALLEGAGFTPILFDTEARSLARALSSTDAIELVVSFNEYYTAFVITRSGVPLFSSTSPLGASDMTRSIMKGCDLTEAEALKLKKQRLVEHSPEDSELFSSMVGLMSSLKDEINKVLAYWSSHGKKEGLPEISRVMVVGTDMALDGALKYLSASLKVPVSVANVWVNVFSLDVEVPEMSREVSLDYAALIGVSLT